MKSCRMINIAKRLSLVVGREVVWTNVIGINPLDLYIFVAGRVMGVGIDPVSMLVLESADKIIPKIRFEYKIDMSESQKLLVLTLSAWYFSRAYSLGCGKELVA